MNKKKTAEKEIYVSVDIEASGPIPGEYSMLSIGACIIGKEQDVFYVELKPISDKYVTAAILVAGLSLEKLKKNGVGPEEAMKKFDQWLNKVCNGRPILVAFNAPFDWSFINYYFHRFLGRNPFGISCIDIKALYMGKFMTTWVNTSKANMKPEVLSEKEHTHHALDDAIEQADIFRKIIEHKG